jgi:hypothetical protein
MYARDDRHIIRDSRHVKSPGFESHAHLDSGACLPGATPEIPVGWLTQSGDSGRKATSFRNSIIVLDVPWISPVGRRRDQAELD